MSYNTDTMDQEQTQPLRLYTPVHVLIATALGGPVAGMLLLAFNYKTMGDVQAAKQWLAGGVVLTLLFFAYALTDFKLSVLSWTPFAYLIVMYYIAKTVVPPGMLKADRRYTKASVLAAAGVGLGYLVLFLAVIFLGGLFIDLTQSS